MTEHTVAGCSSCAREWRHCHEVWVVHLDGGECAGHEACAAPPEAHEQVVVCTDLPGSCRCD